MSSGEAERNRKTPKLHVPLTLEQLAEGLLKTPPQKKAADENPLPKKQSNKGKN